MKKLMIVLILFAMSNVVFSQRTESASAATRDEYLRKSKNQKTTAWVLLGAGAALTVGGIISFSNSFDLFSSNSDDETLAAVVTGAGILSMAGSIPLFASSAKNKNKAMNLSTGIKFENQLYVKQGAFVNHPYPAIAVKIALK